MKKIAYLGAGTWGFSLASLLAHNGYPVRVWTRDESLARQLQKERFHPKLPGVQAPDLLYFTNSLDEVLDGAEIIVESVTSAGIRPVFSEVLKRAPIRIPVILTSKGIEQNTALLLPEVLAELMGEERSAFIGYLGGPSHAEEVIKNLPTSVVCSGYTSEMTELILQLFTTPTFRIYPNMDLRGVCFGGAMKNIIAIACGIADGLGYGDNTKAALMTRGLHEMRKLGVKEGCLPQTLNGLSGMGDLCVTCMSPHSRNYHFGRFIAEGFSPEGAKQKIGMAVEGVYTCVSVRQLGHRHQTPLPIAEAVYEIVYCQMHPREAVRSLLQRAIKEEHL